MTDMHASHQPLKGDIALVTGASRGIGAAIADRLAAQGATVIGTATSDSGAQAIGDRLAPLGGHGRKLDVVDGAGVEALIDAIAKQFGPVSILVNNAGITRDNLLMRMKDEEWQSILDTNLTSVYRTSKAVIRGMMKARKGRIINIASVIGVTGNAGQTNYAAAKAGITRDMLVMRMRDEDFTEVIDTNLSGAFRVVKRASKGMLKARFGRVILVSSVVGLLGSAGQVNYSASKSGLIGLARSLTRELGGRGITANVVAPGFIDTDMTRALPDAVKEGLLSQIALGRLGEADDIAHAVAFLAGPAAGYITGETLHVNGGMYMP